MLVIYSLLLALPGWRLTDTPTGFIPDQDQGVLIGVVQLPPGTSLDRTSEVLARAQQVVSGMDGVASIATFAGLDGASFSQSSNARSEEHTSELQSLMRISYAVFCLKKKKKHKSNKV